MNGLWRKAQHRELSVASGDGDQPRMTPGEKREPRSCDLREINLHKPKRSEKGIFPQSDFHGVVCHSTPDGHQTHDAKHKILSNVPACHGAWGLWHSTPWSSQCRTEIDTVFIWWLILLLAPALQRGPYEQALSSLITGNHGGRDSSFSLARDMQIWRGRGWNRSCQMVSELHQLAPWSPLSSGISKFSFWFACFRHKQLP